MPLVSASQDQSSTASHMVGLSVIEKDAGVIRHSRGVICGTVEDLEAK
jgi:hypothetical protein